MLWVHQGQLNELLNKAAPLRGSEYLRADGEGLHLLVPPTAKVWGCRCAMAGKPSPVFGHDPIARPSSGHQAAMERQWSGH